jgi:hypothetical protein
MLCAATSSCLRRLRSRGAVRRLISLLGGLLALALVWLLFRDADPKDEDVWDAVALGLTQELLAADEQDAPQIVADLWQLQVERDRAMDA